MNSIILNVLTIQAALVGEVLTKLVVDIIDDHSPAVVAIQRVAKSCKPINSSKNYYYYQLEIINFFHPRNYAYEDHIL